MLGLAIAVLALALAISAPASARRNAGQVAAASGVRHCARVVVGHRVASRVRTNQTCTRARRLLRRWLHRGSFPKSQLGWFCAGKRNVTCGGGNGGNAPFIRFRYRR